MFISKGVYRPPRVIRGVDMQTIQEEPDFGKDSVTGRSNVQYHSIMISGADKYRGEPIWKFKNTWGKRWGMHGYGMLPRDGSFGGALGMNFNASYPIVGPRSRYGVPYHFFYCKK